MAASIHWSAFKLLDTKKGKEELSFLSLRLSHHWLERTRALVAGPHGTALELKPKEEEEDLSEDLS